MGNSVGANLSVQLNQDQLICGGSKLKGTIYLDIGKDSISADSLNVRFYGHELTRITRASGGEGGSQTYFGKHQFICLDYVLYRFNGKVNRGRYEYPFEINLPIGVPGKQGFQPPKGNMFQNRPDFFVIEYFLESTLCRQGIMTWDVKNSQEILLSDTPYYAVKTPSFMEPITRPVSFCCCYRTGTMTLLANVDSTNVSNNDKIQIEYAIRNDSTSKVERLEITVREIHHYSAQGAHEKKYFILHRQQIIPDNFDISDKSIDSFRKAVKVATVQIPNVQRSTYHGHLINVWYVVEVQVITPRCSQNPIVTIPITILRNQVDFTGVIPAVEMAFAKPVDWQATKAPMTELHAPPIAVLYQPNPSAPSAPPLDVNSVYALFQTLQQSNEWTEAAVLKNWIKTGYIDGLTPQNIGSVFKCIKGEYSYTAFPDIIGEAMFGRLNCKHISGAAMAVPEAKRAAVCYNFARYCIDKPNAAVEFKCLGMPPYAISLLLISYV